MLQVGKYGYGVQFHAPRGRERRRIASARVGCGGKVLLEPHDVTARYLGPVIMAEECVCRPCSMAAPIGVSPLACSLGGAQVSGLWKSLFTRTGPNETRATCQLPRCGLLATRHQTLAQPDGPVGSVSGTLTHNPG
jgi:hypothetical protein